MPAVYSIDLIAKRDRKIKMDRSIIKGWNVHYQTLKEVEEAARLKKQHQEEEMQKQEQAEDGMSDDEAAQETEAAAQDSEAMFNKKTKSYSGLYGKRPVQDADEQKQIHAILNEKPDAYTAAMSALQEQEA